MSTVRDVWGSTVTFAARESTDFANQTGFNGRQGAGSETNAMQHAYHAAKLGFNERLVQIDRQYDRLLGSQNPSPAHTSGTPNSRFFGNLKEKLGGDLPLSGDLDKITNPDSIKDLYNNEVGFQLGSLAASLGLSWADAKKALEHAAKNGDLIVDEIGDPRMASAIDKVKSQNAPVDLDGAIQAATNGETGIYFDENNNPQPYSFVDGAIGDNKPGDGYAYDYTLDLGDDHDRWKSNVTTNEYGETSPRPVARSDRGEVSQAKPVILDLDGDGVEIAVGAATSFDLDDDGYLENASWAAQDDGFLVVDLSSDGLRGSSDGVIDQAKELAFSLWGGQGSSDLEALATAVDVDGNLIFDSNGDGVLDSNDVIWNELRIWQDLDQDGETEGDGSELKTLAAWGIASINLGYDNGAEYGDADNVITVFGNTLFGSASYTKDDGTVVEGGVGDVALAFNALGYREIDTAYGYKIEFETGEELRYGELAGTGLADLDLDALALDGAIGDDRANNLTAVGHSRTVQISGGDGDDTVWGGANDDWLSGDLGADDIRGGNGNDVIFADADDFTSGTVLGGSGYDTLLVNAANAVNVDLHATGFESFFGSDQADTVSAGGATGDIAIRGGDGADLLTDGEGNDILSGDGGDDTLTSGIGDDLLLGGLGADGLSGGDDDDALYGGDGDDNLAGGSGSDELHGGDGADSLQGGTGDDEIFGGAGNDQLEDGEGDDVVDGGEGDDTFLGTGTGDDRFYGGEGNDTFFDAQGDDTYLGGEGDDVFHQTGNSDYDVFIGGGGYDVLHLHGNRSAYSVIWRTGINQIEVTSIGYGIAIDTRGVELFRFDDGTVMGVVPASYGDQSFENYVERATSSNSSNMWSGWQDNNYVHATNLGDYRYVGSGDDHVRSFGGNDWVHGGSGNDLIEGGDGNDNLDGEAGTDRIFGQNGNDFIEGHGGADLLQGDSGNDTIHAGSGDDDALGGDGADLINGNDGDDQLAGGSGNDTINGDSGGDQIWGEAGDDSVTGGSGADVIYGGSGADNLSGNSGSDLILGEMGNDVLSGGSGADKLYGGFGNDVINADTEADIAVGGYGQDTIFGGADDDYLVGDSHLTDLEITDLIHNDMPTMSRHAPDHIAMLYLASRPELISYTAPNWSIGQMAGLARSHFGMRQDAGWSGSVMKITFDAWEMLASQTNLLSYANIASEASVFTQVAYHYTMRMKINPNHTWVDTHFDSAQYLANYVDVQHDIGGNITELAKHYLNSGMADGRIYTELSDDAFDDQLDGGDGKDVLVGGRGADVIDGGPGILDISNYYRSEAGVSVDLSTGTAIGGDAEGDTLINIEGLVGSELSDTLTGNSDDNFLEGLGGGDAMSGGDGNDQILGGEGNDTIDGGAGSDRLNGGEGDDRIDGGTGNDDMGGDVGADIFVFDNATALGDDIIYDFEDGIDLIEVSNAVFADLAISTNGSDVEVAWNDGTLTLKGVELTDITQDDFVFV